VTEIVPSSISFEIILKSSRKPSSFIGGGVSSVAMGGSI